MGRSNWNTTVWKYDTILEKWEEIMELQTTRRHHVLASSEEAVYVIGGFGKHRVMLDLVDKIHGQQIQSLPPLPNPTYNAASFFYEDKLHVFKDSKNVWILDGEKWDKAFDQHLSSDLPKFEFHSVLPYQKEFYFTCKYSSSLHKFTLKKSLGVVWSLSLEQFLGKFQNEAENVCLVDGKIYNFSSGPDLSTVEVYDITSKEFKVVFESKNEEELDFSPYSGDYSFGCFGLVKYPHCKLPIGNPSY